MPWHLLIGGQQPKWLLHLVLSLLVEKDRSCQAAVNGYQHLLLSMFIHRPLLPGRAYIVSCQQVPTPSLLPVFSILQVRAGSSVLWAFLVLPKRCLPAANRAASAALGNPCTQVLNEALMGGEGGRGGLHKVGWSHAVFSKDSILKICCNGRWGAHYNPIYLFIKSPIITQNMQT